MKEQADQTQPPFESIPEGLEYKQEYWDGALSMIRQREKAALWWKTVACAAVLLAIGGATAWYHYESETPGDRITQVEAISMDDIYQKENAAADQYTLGIEEANATNAGAATGSHTPNTGGERSIDHAYSTGSQSDEMVDGTTSIETSPASNLGLDAPATVRSSSDSEATSGLPNLSEFGDSGLPVGQESALNDSPTDSNTLTDQEEEQTTDTSSGTETDFTNNEAQTSPGFDQGDDSVTPPSIPLSEDSVITMSVVPLTSIASDGLHDVVHEDLAFEDESRPDFLRLDDSVLNPAAALGLHPIEISAAADLLDQGIPSIDHLQPAIPMRPFEANLILGSNLLSDYGRSGENPSFDPLVGIAATYNYSRVWSVHSGLEYFSISGIDRPMSTFYSNPVFGEYLETTKVHTRRAHFLSVPLNVSMKFHANHRLFWSTGMDVLMQASQTVVVEQEQDGAKTLVSETNDKGYLDGFRTVSFYAGMGYEYRLNDRLNLGLRLHYGLNDITLDDHQLFDKQGNDRNSRALAYVRFNVW